MDQTERCYLSSSPVDDFYALVDSALNTGNHPSVDQALPDAINLGSFLQGVRTDKASFEEDFHCVFLYSISFGLHGSIFLLLESHRTASLTDTHQTYDIHDLPIAVGMS